MSGEGTGRHASAFPWAQMLVALGGYLGQMGHAQHLAVAAQPAQQSPDDLCHSSANPNIHLIEDEGWDSAAFGGYNLNCQADS